MQRGRMKSSPQITASAAWAPQRCSSLGYFHDNTRQPTSQHLAVGRANWGRRDDVSQGARGRGVAASPLLWKLWIIRVDYSQRFVARCVPCHTQTRQPQRRPLSLEERTKFAQKRGRYKCKQCAQRWRLPPGGPDLITRSRYGHT